MELPKTMRALVAYAPGDYRLVRDFPVPRATGKDLIVKVEGCGVCAGDIKAFHGAPSFWGGDGSPAYIKAPMIPGHEFCGTVVEVGEGMEGFEVGDHVVSEQIVPCWQCKFCKSGRYWMCQKHEFIRLSEQRKWRYGGIYAFPAGGYYLQNSKRYAGGTGAAG